MTNNNPQRPNLFDYATSELSQDAFLCWLLKWADPMYRKFSEALHEAGSDLIRLLSAEKKGKYQKTALLWSAYAISYRQQADDLAKMKG